MSLLRISFRVAVIVLILVLPTLAHAKPTVLQKCKATKLKAAATASACAYKAAGSAALIDAALGLAKSILGCSEKFAKTIGKADKKYGPECSALVLQDALLQTAYQQVAIVSAVLGVLCTTTDCRPAPPTGGCQCNPACPAGFTCCCCAPGTESGGATGTSVCVDLSTGKNPLGAATNFCGTCTTWCHHTCTEGVCACSNGGPACPDTACQGPSNCCLLEEDAFICVQDPGTCSGG